MTVLGVLLFVVAAVLLTSVGGAGIVAAPVTLPLLFVVVRRHPTPSFRGAGAIFGGLTAAELAWGLVYLAGGEIPVLVWLAPTVLGLLTAVAFGQPQPSSCRRSSSIPK